MSRQCRDLLTDNSVELIVPSCGVSQEPAGHGGREYSPQSVDVIHVVSLKREKRARERIIIILTQSHENKNIICNITHIHVCIYTALQLPAPICTYLFTHTEKKPSKSNYTKYILLSVLMNI